MNQQNSSNSVIPLNSSMKLSSKANYSSQHILLKWMATLHILKAVNNVFSFNI